MGKRLVRKLLVTLRGAGFLLLLTSLDVQAFELGIDLDGFLTTLEASVVGLGLIVGLIGVVGMIVAKMENTYGQFFSGFLNFFVNAGILGGASALLGAVGLASGAILVL